MPNKNRSNLSRRDILKTTGSVLTAGFLSDSIIHAADKTSKMPVRTLGKTGKQISLFTLGTGHLRKSIMNIEKAGDIVESALSIGVTSIDTAPNYDESEEFLGEILKSHRDKVFLATKTEEKTYEGCWKLLEKSLNRLQTETIDLVYIHNFGVESRFPSIEETLSSKGTLGALREAKKQGLIRYIGASGHLYPSRFKVFMEIEDVEVLLLALNFVERYQYNFEKKVVAPAHEQNKGIVAMKVLGGARPWREGTGRLAKEYFSDTIRYSLGIPGVSTLNIGARSVEEIEMIAKTIQTYKSLSEEERTPIAAKGKELAQAWDPMFGLPTT